MLTWRRTLGPPGPCRLSVRPLLTGRDHGALHFANDAFRFDAAVTGEGPGGPTMPCRPPPR